MDDSTVPEHGLDALAFEAAQRRGSFGLPATVTRTRASWVAGTTLALAAAAWAAHAWIRPSVAVAPVVRGTAVDAVYGAGTIEAVNRVSIKARVAGPISRLLAEEGQRVAEGQSLAWVDAPALHHDVARGESDVAAARGRVTPQLSALRASERVLEAQCAQAELELQRAESGAKLGMSAEQDLERARLQVSQLEGQLASNRAQQAELQITARSDAKRAQAGLESSRARATDVEVRSPMAGVVLARAAELGEVVSVNQELFRVGDVDHLQVEAIVDEADIGRVRTGMAAAVRVVAFPAHTLRAEVRRIGPAALPGQRGFRVELALAQALDGLRPGMSAECNIILAQHEAALLAPVDAIHGDHVWVVDAAGVVQRRSVATGLRDLGHLELLQGVSAGELVVVGSEVGLVDGAKVSPRVRAEAER